MENIKWLILGAILLIGFCFIDWRPKCNNRACLLWENGRCKAVERRKKIGYDKCYVDGFD